MHFLCDKPKSQLKHKVLSLENLIKNQSYMERWYQTLSMQYSYHGKLSPQLQNFKAKVQIARSRDQGKHCQIFDLFSVFI